MNQSKLPTPEFESIGPYRVQGILGQGGMGTVYKAVHAKSNEVVAVKVIAAAMAQHQRFRRRFDAEIQTLVKLKHPGIVQLIGFGEEKGLLFYSMEYVDGENLQQVLRREGRLPWQRVVDIGIEVCAALKHAHDFGVIHRDLKPANLMIQSNGHVKLTDFGIAKLFGAADATVEGSVLGTADFMAPEQAEGKPVTVRSDLYALGSVCYAALAGRSPFQGKSIPEVLFNVRYGNYPKLQTLVPEVPTELAILVEELLERDASRRPPTGLVVGNRLQSLKLGLQHKPTIVVSNPTADVTKLKELTSIDLDAAPSLLRELGDLKNAPKVSDDSNQEGEIWPTADSPAVTHRTSIAGKGGRPRDNQERQNGPSADAQGVSHGPTPRPTPASPYAVNPHEKTVAQSQSSSLPSEYEQTSASGQAPGASGQVANSGGAGSAHIDHPSGIDFMGKTSFTEVNDDVRTRSATTFSSVEDEHTPSSHWFAVGTLCFLLACCIGFVIYMLQKPSANNLHRAISVAMQNNDDDLWLDTEPTAVRFKAIYPNDPRIADADTVIQEAELIRTTRQLQRRARRNNTDQLDAIEQAFLEVLTAQQVSTDEAMKKLNAFLTMFGNASTSNRDKLLVLQAERIQKQLEDSSKNLRNDAFRSLKAQMDWAEANLTPAVREKWYLSLLELFENKPWASELVQKAREQIKVESTSEPATE